MKYRSLLKLFSLNILTLGFYEYLWLSQTRQEMVAKYSAAIPRVKWLLLLYFLQIAALLGLLLAVTHFIPQYNRQLDAIKRPSAECLIGYAKSSDQERLGQPASVSRSCKQTVDTYYSENDRINQRMTYAVSVIVACVIFIIINPVFYARWFSHYSRAVAKVTSGRISQDKAMFLFFFTPPSIGMLVVQNAFNQAISHQSSTT